MSVVKNIILGVLLAGICVVVFSGFISEMAQNSNLITDDSSFNTTYVKISDIKNVSESMAEEIDNAELESSSVFVITTEGAFKSVKLVRGASTTITSMTSSLVQEQSIIPGWIITLTTVLIGITITILILNAFLRWRT